MDEERLYIVTYYIRDPKRWRTVFRLMKAYGEWLQLSVFQCRMSRARHAEFVATLKETIRRKDDHVLILDLGVADKVDPRVTAVSNSVSAFSITRTWPVWATVQNSG
jgi:CRISPR-associated protein Cas2